MPKGRIYKNEILKYDDPDTGREVWRLSPPEFLSTHPYFYFNCISKDNLFAFYGSEISGSRQLYRQDLVSGDLMQLTDREGVLVYQACLSNDDKTILYATKDSIIRLFVDTLEEEVLYTPGPEWWTIKTFGVTPDCTHVSQVQLHRDDLVPRDKKMAELSEQWAMKPRCRIVQIDVNNKTANVVFDEKLWVAHPQLRPVFKDKIMFCHEGPGHLIESRIWLMDADGSNIICPRHHLEGESFTHEYWFPDGSALGYVARIVEKDTRKVKEVTIRKIDMDTMKETTIMPCTYYSHCVSNIQNTMIVGDGHNPEKPYVFLSDLRSGKEIAICRHDTKWSHYFDTGTGEFWSQDAHPHPQFSQDATKIIFNSDREGKPCVYLTDISDLV